LDSDAYLWQSPPPAFLAADVAAAYPDNQPAWARRGAMQSDSLNLEQHMPSAELNLHRNDLQSPFQGISICYLFADEGDAAMNAGSRGFTHLIGGAEHNTEALDRLAGWVQDALPDHYARCLEIAQQEMGAAAIL